MARGKTKESANKIQLSELKIAKVNCRAIEKPELVENRLGTGSIQLSTRIPNHNDGGTQTPPKKGNEAISDLPGNDDTIGIITSVSGITKLISTTRVANSGGSGIVMQLKETQSPRSESGRAIPDKFQQETPTEEIMKIDQTDATKCVPT